MMDTTLMHAVGRTAMRGFKAHKIALVSLVFLIAVSALCLCAPLIAAYDPVKINLDAVNKPPSTLHWLGTDKGGRDIAARLLYGGFVTLKIAFITTILIVWIGTIIGSIAGYFGGIIDSAIMRFTDFALIFPLFLFIIVLKTIVKEPGIGVLIVSIGCSSWGVCARVVRGSVLAEKENEYIMAAVSIGCPWYKVILKHLLPNIASTVIVQAVLVAAAMIAIETSLSFLGFGVPAGMPSWGNMMSDAVRPEVLRNQWWVWLPAGLLITLTILALNFIGDGLKNAFNPRA